MYYRGDNDWLDYQAIQHWKYLRRERVNGKWRYYYEDKKSDKLNRVNNSHLSKGTIDVTGSSLTHPNAATGSYNHKIHFVENKKTGTSKAVDKETWDKTKTGDKLYIGDTPLKDVAKEQIAMGISFVKDLFKGNVTTEKSALNAGKAPDSFKPEKYGNFKEYNLNGEKGYIDSDNEFFAGDYETARQKKWEKEYQLNKLGLFRTRKGLSSTDKNVKVRSASSRR